MEGEGNQQLVVFRAGGGQEFALPIDQVHEVVRHVPPRPVASTLPWLTGVTSLRGAVLPVYDLARRLGLDGGEPARQLITAGSDGEQVALAVEDVEEIVTVDATAIAPPRGLEDPSMRGIARMGERMVVILDARQIVDHSPAGAAAQAPAGAREEVIG